jgi:lipopolysaccharide heptosyltransferase I
MATTNSTQANPRRILIVRLSSMGDVIHGLPAAAMLRQAFPDAGIGWLIEERWAELLCALSTPRSGKRSPERPLVDAIHTIKLKQWRSALFSTQTWERIAASLSDLRSQQYDIAIDLQGAARSAILARWSGASTIYGAIQPRENLASLWYTRKNITQHSHVVEQYAEIAQSVVGQPRPIPDAIFPCDPVAEQVVEKRARELDLHDFVILNPGAGWGAKQWPAERYGVVAQGLARKGIRSFINFGPGEESLAKLAETASDGTSRALSFSIGELLALTRRARLFIGGDTGPMALAAALHIPVVALFGPTNPARNGPFRTKSIVLRNAGSPTTLTHRDQPDPGLLAITSDEVLDAALRLLRGAHD